MAKYNKEYKLKIVKQVLSGMTQNEAVRQYGVNKGDVQKWVAAYKAHGEAGLDKKRGSYSGGFKQMVIEDMRDNGLSCREAAAKHVVSGHHVVSKWERSILRGDQRRYMLTSEGGLWVGEKVVHQKLINKWKRT